MIVSVPRALPFLAAASWILAVLPASAAPPVLTLEDCLEIARENHPALRAEREETRAQRAELGVTRAGLLPRLDLLASASRGETSFLTASGLTRTEAVTPVSLSASQLLYDFGKTPSEVGSSRGLLGASLSALRTRELEVRFGVQQAYFNLLRAQRAAAVAEETLRQRQELLRITQERFDKGERPRFDVTRSAIDAEGARIERISSRARLEIARRELLTRMGVPGREWSPVADVLEAPGEDYEEPRLLEAALSRRPELQTLRERLEAQESLQESARRDFYPALSAFGSYELSRSETDGVSLGRTGTWQAGLRARLNLFGGLSSLEGLRRRGAQASKAKEELEALSQQVRFEVQEALFLMRESRERISAAQALVRSAEENLELWSKAYHAGKGNIIYVTDAQGQLLGARLALINSLADHRISVARLERAVGLPAGSFPR